MNRRRALIAAAALAGAALAGAIAQTPKDPTEPTSQPAGPATRPGKLDFPHLTLDLKARQVVISAEVCRQEGELEFFLCGGANKEHESILTTQAKGWQLHAALVALGLTAGKPARWVQAPEGDEGRFLPPQGADLKIQVRWNDRDGKPRQAQASEWLHPLGKGARPEKWVFVGSEITTDRRYAADIDGELISLANFAQAVIDVPFESSAQQADLSFKAGSDVIPDVGTPVEVVISPVQGAEAAEHARVMLEIDRFGRISLEGQCLRSEDLRPWARQYLARHAKGKVVLRVDSKALAWDVYNVREQLRLARLYDVDVEYVLPAEPILPRSPQDAQESLKWWAQQFDHAQELLFDPADEARAVLAEIERAAEQANATQQMWAQYAQQLRTLLDRYRTSTQPAPTE